MASALVESEHMFLPDKISHRIKVRNRHMASKLRYSEKCINWDNKRFTYNHGKQTEKHILRIVELNKKLSTKTIDNKKSSEMDIFTADLSQLSPVDDSKFKVLRNIVAALKTEKVSLEDICTSMQNRGRVYDIKQTTGAFGAVDVPVRNKHVTLLSVPAAPNLITRIEKRTVDGESNVDNDIETIVSDFEPHGRSDEAFTGLDSNTTAATNGDVNELRKSIEFVNEDMFDFRSKPKEKCVTPVPIPVEKKRPERSIFVTQLNYIPLKPPKWAEQSNKSCHSPEISLVKCVPQKSTKSKSVRQNSRKKPQATAIAPANNVPHVKSKQLSLPDGHRVRKRLSTVNESYRGESLEDRQQHMIDQVGYRTMDDACTPTIPRLGPNIRRSSSESDGETRTDAKPLLYRLLHDETDSLCERQIRWLTKTPEYIP